MADNTLRVKVNLSKGLRFRTWLAGRFLYVSGKLLGCKTEIQWLNSDQITMCRCWLNVLQFPDESDISEKDAKCLETEHADYCQRTE